jgi:hypothetical protein
MIHLIQDRSTDDALDAEEVLSALSIPLTPRNFNRYFPAREGQEFRCPTLNLLERFAHLDRTDRQCGV